MFRPVDVASIAAFRFMFGAVMVWEVTRFFNHDWIRKYYIEPEFYFKYFGFSWIEPWGGDGMYIHFIVVGLVAACVALGFLYRLSSVILFLGFSFWFLLDQTRYLNHLYLVMILTFLMIFIPAHRNFSLDTRIWPGIRKQTISAWYLFLLRFQIGLVYFYAGIAKLNSDWLRGEPLRQWLPKRSDLSLIGPFLETEFAVWFFSYGGLLFDLFVVPALLWKKTRVPAFLACVFFHSMNKWMFNIGIFPVVMLAATLIFFPADWPRKFLRFASGNNNLFKLTTKEHLSVGPNKKKIMMAFLGLFMFFQVFMPLRHFLYPGNVHWTEEGHRFAWHMKLRTKRANVQFYAHDPVSGKTWMVDQSDFLTNKQMSKVGRWPDMCLQFAKFLKDEIKDQGYPLIEIKVHSVARLNDHPKTLIIDPEIDLASQPRNLWPAKWILPMKE